jgi:hypothetical protein
LSIRALGGGRPRPQDQMAFRSERDVTAHVAKAKETLAAISGT